MILSLQAPAALASGSALYTGPPNPHAILDKINTAKFMQNSKSKPWGRDYYRENHSWNRPQGENKDAKWGYKAPSEGKKWGATQKETVADKIEKTKQESAKRDAERKQRYEDESRQAKESYDAVMREREAERQEVIDTAKRKRHEAFLATERSQMAQVEKAMSTGKTTWAVAMLEKMTSKGSQSGPYLLGTMYLKGEGVKADKSKALTWFYNAARNGSANGSYALARAYFLGEGVKQDYPQAVKWFGVSKLPISQYLLGCMYVEGVGVEKDYRKAWTHLKEAALAGDALARASLGELAYLGLGMRKSVVEAKTWLEESAQDENPKALFYLSNLYSTGNGVDKDEKKASQYLSQYKTIVATIKTSDDKLEQLALKDLDSMGSRMERLSKDFQPDIQATKVAEKRKRVIIELPKHEEKSDAVANKSNKKPSMPLPQLYDRLEELVKKFYRQAKITRTETSFAFEFKTHEAEHLGKKLEIPKLDGIMGKIDLKSGRYPGKEYLPSTTHETLFTSLLMAPYSASEDKHLLSRLLFPPNAPVEFLTSFKALIDRF